MAVSNFAPKSCTSSAAMSLMARIHKERGFRPDQKEMMTSLLAEAEAPDAHFSLFKPTFNSSIYQVIDRQ